MPSRLTPTTEWGEAALAQMTARFVDYLQLLDLSNREPDTVQVGRHVTGRRAAKREENALVDLVAVTENFVAARFLALNPAKSSSEVLSWEKKRKAWKRYHALDFADPAAFPEWEPLLGFVEARNAIQHGLGFLTELQLTTFRDESKTRLASAGLTLVGHRVRVDKEAVERCLQVGEGFVARLDAAAP